MGKKGTKKEKKRKKQKRRNSTSSSSSSSSSSTTSGSSVSLSSLDEETKLKLIKKLKKLKRKERLKKKKKKKERERERKALKNSQANGNEAGVKEEKKRSEDPGKSTSVVASEALLEKSKSLAPMTKEEWEKQQNMLTRVYDETTGRTRLVKGTGEIVEECVSRERHLAINKQATKGDGDYFQKRLKEHLKEMTLTVHGFPSDVAALRFEWAWQHPKRSRRLKGIVPARKTSTESSFDYCLRVMFTMLTVSPWCRLPLTIRWLSADVMVDPPPNLTPPMHMPIVYGPVKSAKLKSPSKGSRGGSGPTPTATAETDEVNCQICDGSVSLDRSLQCLNKRCQVRWHVLCIGKHFIDNEGAFTGTQSEDRSGTLPLLPVEGTCPSCDSVILWGDLVRRKNGCYSEIMNASQPRNNTYDDST